MSARTHFHSMVATNHFGNSLISTTDLNPGIVVQKFLTAVTEKSFNGDMNAPLDERHVIVIGEDNGKLLYGRVISDAKYINHSCDPNCKVNSAKEVISVRHINKKEELTIAYDEGAGEWKPEWNFHCLCNATNCRKFINSYNRTKNHKL
jgi:hypothetical protein